MLGFISGFNSITCDICHNSFMATGTGASQVFDDYTCDNCNWKGCICNTCPKECPKCGKKIESNHYKYCKALGGNVFY